MTAVEHIAGRTWHGRKGDTQNAFAYGVDYLLFNPEAELRLPWPLRRNRAGLVSLQDTDHGGVPGKGRGAAWVRDVLERHGLAALGPVTLELLAQPRVLGHVFNPVAFWLVRDGDGDLRAAIAEVTNTYGDRHSYLVHHDDLAPIGPRDTIRARKIFHVSPFQPMSGDYAFGFDVDADRLAIRIDYTAGNGGLVATLAGRRAPATTRSLLTALLRRPLGSRRVLALIHWQALRLWWKGVPFRARPAPPEAEVSR